MLRSYDIRLRSEQLKTKLEQIAQKSHTLLELRQEKTSHRLEVTITLLIMMEILQSYYFHMKG